MIRHKKNRQVAFHSPVVPAYSSEAWHDHLQQVDRSAPARGDRSVARHVLLCGHGDAGAEIIQGREAVGSFALRDDQRDERGVLPQAGDADERIRLESTRANPSRDRVSSHVSSFQRDERPRSPLLRRDVLLQKNEHRCPRSRVGRMATSGAEQCPPHQFARWFRT